MIDALFVVQFTLGWRNWSDRFDLTIRKRRINRERQRGEKGEKSARIHTAHREIAVKWLLVIFVVCVCARRESSTHFVRKGRFFSAFFSLNFRHISPPNAPNGSYFQWLIYLAISEARHSPFTAHIMCFACLLFIQTSCVSLWVTWFLYEIYMNSQALGTIAG